MELLEQRLTHEVIGAFFAVYNELDHGYLEAVYANALELELKRRGLRVAREVPVTVRFRGTPVGYYRADLLVADVILVEIKASRILDAHARLQTLNYLRGTGLAVGLLLHFGPKPHFERLVCHRSDPRRSAPAAAGGIRAVPRSPDSPRDQA